MDVEPKIFKCGCGGEAELTMPKDGVYVIVCKSCGKKTGPFTNKRMVVNLWNESAPHGEPKILENGTLKVYRDGYLLKKEKDDEGWVYPNIYIYENNRYDYPVFSLNGKTRSVHRIFAEAYIENDDPLLKDKVDHKDGNKKNWLPENLEWVTAAENNRRANEMGLRTYGPATRYDAKTCKCVILRNLDRIAEGRGMSLTKLSQAIGKNKGYFSQYVSSSTFPPTKALLECAKVLKCDPRDFWEGWDESDN